MPSEQPDDRSDLPPPVPDLSGSLPSLDRYEEILEEEVELACA